MITISEDDTKLFENNGFSYQDVSDTVEHYRSIGFDDDAIQSKINARIEQFKEAAPLSGIEALRNTPAVIAPRKEKSPLEKFMQGLKWTNEASRAAWTEGSDMIRTADLEIKDAFGRIQETEKRELEQIGNKAPYDYGLAEKSALPIASFQEKDAAKRGYIEAVKMLPMMWETIKRGGIGAGAGAIAGGAIGAGRSLLTTKADVLPAAIQGAYLGAVWGGRITGSLAAAELEAGLARHELKQENEKIKREGGEPLSMAQINYLSACVGAANGTLEIFGLDSVLKTMPKGHLITNLVKGKAAKDIIRDKAVRAKLKEVFKDYGEALAVEPGTEMLQETSNIIAEYYADKWGQITDETLPERLKTEVPRIFETGQSTFGAMMFLGGFGSAAKTASILTKQGMERKAAERAADNMTKEQRFEFISENMDTLMHLADDMPDVQEYDKRAELHQNLINEIKKGVDTAENNDINDEVINDSAEIMSESIANLANEIGMKTEDVNKLFKIKVQTLTDAEAVKQYEADTQTALKGGIEKTETVFKQNILNNKELNFAKEKYEINQEQKNEYKNYSSVIEKILNKRENFEGNISIGKTPEALIECGLSDLPLETSQKIILKMKTKKRHNAKTNIIKGLPYLINNPIAVFKSNSENSNSVIVLLNARDKNNLPFMVSVEKNNKKGVNEVNFVTSGYGRKENFFKTLINNNKLIKLQNNNIPDWLQEFLKNPKDSVSEKRNSVSTDTIENTADNIPHFQENINPSVTKHEAVKLDNTKLEEGKKYSVKHDNKTEILTFAGLGNNKRNKEIELFLYFRDKYNREIPILNDNAEVFEIEKEKSKIYEGSIDELLEAENLFSTELKAGSQYAVVKLKSRGKTKKHIWEYVKRGTEYINGVNSDVLIFKNKSGNLVNVNAGSYIYKADTKIEDEIKEYWEKYSKEQEQDYNEQTTAQGIENSRGFTYQKTGFDGSNAKENMIVLLKGRADKSTLLHEFAHIYLNALNELARENKRAKEMLLKINKQLRYDGREYTRAQHEKFAMMFEAYIKTGKAPSYGLKKAFEHFRKWLGDIYNGISASGKYEISKEWQDIFDELLGNKSVGVKEKQMREMLEKARRYADLKISKILDTKALHQNLLTDKQIRYRDTAYSIIFYALQHSKDKDTRNWIKNIPQLRMILGAKSTKKDAKGLARQREKLELVLSETEDAFSANDGFQPEWGEFFNNPRVSYENQVQGADAELALDAYNVIADKKYLLNENSLEEFTQADVDRAKYELDYILEEYKKENEDSKTSACCAFFEWIDTIHPYMREEFLKQWETETNKIDRYQALDKWQRAKEDLKLEAERMKQQGDNHWQFMDFTRIILKRLDFLTEADKAKLFDRIKDLSTMRDIARNLDDVMDFAETLYGVSERRHLADDIQREVKQTIHEWQNGIKKTKYTYPANKLFERLREINRMTREEIEYLYDAQTNEEREINYADDKAKTGDFYEQLEKDFITFKYNGSYYNSAEFLSDLLKRIQNAKFEAKLARDEIDFNRRVEKINLVDELALITDKRASKMTKAVKKAAELNAAGANFNGFLKMLFDDSIKEKLSLDYLYAQRDAQTGADRRYFIEKAKKIFGFSGKFSEMQLFNKFIDMNKAGEFEIRQRYTPDMVNGTYRITEQDRESGKNITVKTINLKPDTVRSQWEPELVKLSRMQVLYYYIQSLNPESYKMLTDMGSETRPPMGQFDEFEFNEMINQLTPQEKLLGKLMQTCAEKYWNKLNEYHIKKYHKELGKVKNYFPRASETGEVKVLEIFNDFVQYSGTGKFLKIRTAGPGVRIKAVNPLAALFDHMERANTIIIMGERLDLMNRVLREPNLKNKLEAVWDEKVTNEFYNQITGSLFTGQSVNMSLTEGFFGKIINNTVKANIFFKPQIGLKQLISFMNYGKGDEYVSAQEWMTAFAKQILTPAEWKKNIEYMMNIPYLKDRFARGGSSDALKRELETRIFSKISLLDDFWSIPVKYGDIGAIILGGKPYIDCLIKKGMPEAEAVKIFIETTVNDQQSSIPSTLSNLQRNSAKTPWGKLIFAYQNTPWQYYRQCTNTVMEAIQTPSKKNILKASKMLLLYGWFFPAVFNTASSLSPLRFYNTGEDDDFWKDINPLTTFASLLTQHPVFGEAVKGLLDALDGKPYNSSDLFSRYIKSLNKLVRDIKKDELTLEDVFDAAASIAEAAAGAPAHSVLNSLEGAGDIMQGDIQKGALKAAGYSDYRAERVSGEND